MGNGRDVVMPAMSRGVAVVVPTLGEQEQSGPLYRLQELAVGHVVEIHRSDGMVARFRVTEAKMVEKDAFPTAEVYGPTEEPTLRLITCGGLFDPTAKSYEGNLLVFAEHIENIAA